MASAEASAVAHGEAEVTMVDGEATIVDEAAKEAEDAEREGAEWGVLVFD